MRPHRRLGVIRSPRSERVGSAGRLEADLIAMLIVHRSRGPRRRSSRDTHSSETASPAGKCRMPDSHILTPSKNNSFGSVTISNLCVPFSLTPLCSAVYSRLCEWLHQHESSPFSSPQHAIANFALRPCDRAHPASGAERVRGSRLPHSRAPRSRHSRPCGRSRGGAVFRRQKRGRSQA